MSNKELLVHLRAMDEEGKILSNGGATFYAVPSGMSFQYDVAYCNPKDVFCKKIGRAIATGRFNKHGPVNIVDYKTELVFDLVNIARTVGDKRPTPFFEKLVEKLVS